MCNFTELGETYNMMIKYDTNILQEYASPSVKVIEVNAQRVLCQSNGNYSMSEYDYGSGGFSEQ